MDCSAYLPKADWDSILEQNSLNEVLNTKYKNTKNYNNKNSNFKIQNIKYILHKIHNTQYTSNITNPKNTQQYTTIDKDTQQ